MRYITGTHFFLVTAFAFLLFPISNALTAQNSFVYIDLDKAILKLWLSESKNVDHNTKLLQNVQGEWLKARREIRTLQISHLDIEGFIEDQEMRIRGIQNSISNNRPEDVIGESYLLLSDFKEIRNCFTNDEYLLDYMLEANNSYVVIHNIIHDQMMGLYEWSEFIWFIDQLKCNIELVESKFEESKTEITNSQPMRLAIDKINTCLRQLDLSVETAYQPNFSLPCDDTGVALRQLFRDYSVTSKYRL